MIIRVGCAVIVKTICSYISCVRLTDFNQTIIIIMNNLDAMNDKEDEVDGNSVLLHLFILMF